MCQLADVEKMQWKKEACFGNKMFILNKIEHKLLTKQ